MMYKYRKLLTNSNILLEILGIGILFVNPIQSFNNKLVLLLKHERSKHFDNHCHSRNTRPSRSNSNRDLSDTTRSGC